MSARKSSSDSLELPELMGLTVVARDSNARTLSDNDMVSVGFSVVAGGSVEVRVFFLDICCSFTTVVPYCEPSN